MGFIITYHRHRDRIKTCIFRLLFGQSCTSGVEVISQFHNACTQTAAIYSFPTGEVFRKASSCDICCRTHCRPLALSRDLIVNLCTVTYCINIRKICLLVLVHHDRAAVHFNT